MDGVSQEPRVERAGLHVPFLPTCWRSAVLNTMKSQKYIETAENLIQKKLILLHLFKNFEIL